MIRPMLTGLSGEVAHTACGGGPSLYVFQLAGNEWQSQARSTCRLCSFTTELVVRAQWRVCPEPAASVGIASLSTGGLCCHLCSTELREHVWGLIWASLLI